MMKRLTLTAVLALLACAALAPGARAAFDLKDFDLTLTKEAGSSSAATQAGSHPYEVVNSFEANYTGEGLSARPEGEPKEVTVALPPGFVGDSTAIPRCPAVVFASTSGELCPLDSKVGEVAVEVNEPGQVFHEPLYNLTPPPGVPARLGFKVEFVPVVVDFHIEQKPPYRLLATSSYIRQSLRFFGLSLGVWGVPAEHGTGAPDRPFVTLPTSCEGPQASSYEAFSWEGVRAAGSALTHDNSEPPVPTGFSGCGKLGFHPSVASQATTDAAETATGLDFSIDFDQQGLRNPEGLAQSTIEEARVTLPEGVTADPSLAEGIGVCTPGELEAEKIDTPAGGGCPNGSKVGVVEVQTPLLEGTIGGSVYLAAPHENPFDSLLAFYIVLKDPGDGLLVKLPAEVAPDPETGQLVTTVREIPQLPFSHFQFHFREGQRAPLISPPRCGTYTTEARLTPWASPSEPLVETATFQIDHGVGGGPCPSGPSPFHPQFTGGTESNQAASYSPFLMRIARADGEQDITRFSAELPPGLVARLAGTSRCTDTQIAIAKAKSGLQERANPSCPSGSQIGAVTAAAGVGSALTYVPGSLYMAGPYNGAPLSVVAIVPAVAGPFDVGTVAVREALRVDPRSALVTVDGAASDPIPHILAGIPLKVRDIRVDVTHPDFTLNPTSCEPSAVGATLWGAGENLFSTVDDNPVSLSSRYQAAGCARLGFKPRLALRLYGGTHRGAHPSLRGLLRPRAHDANLRRLVLRLPRSAFLDQAHIRTICTRVQFAAGSGHGEKCPKAAIYGHAKAYTPLLSEPLQGPVYLRSSSHNLPDLVAALHGIVDVEAVGRIDSKHGGIRTTFNAIPDAPISRVVIQMQGGKKGLVVNSTNLCRRPHRANAAMDAQNGRRQSAKPLLRPRCPKQRRHKRHRHR